MEQQAKVTVIIPAAGSRPGQRPTWLERRPDGVLLLSALLEDLVYDHVGRVVVAVKPDHVRAYCGGSTEALEVYLNGQLAQHCKKQGQPAPPKVDVYELQQDTTSAPTTVVAVIEGAGLSGPIFVKDADGAFPHTVVPGNYVVAMRVTPENSHAVHNIPSKSFVEHCGGLLSNIKEKRMISDEICTGGYGFDDAAEFCRASAKMHATTEEARRFVTEGMAGRVFTSHIVFQLMLDGAAFTVKFSPRLDDWKTPEAMAMYNRRFRNLYVALEGVLFEPCSDIPPFTATPLAVRCKPVAKNIESLRASVAGTGARVVVTTQEPHEHREEVLDLLHRGSVPFHDVLFGVLRSNTVAIVSTDPCMAHPAATAHSLPTGSTELAQLL